MVSSSPSADLRKHWVSLCDLNTHALLGDVNAAEIAQPLTVLKGKGIGRIIGAASPRHLVGLCDHNRRVSPSAG